MLEQCIHLASLVHNNIGRVNTHLNTNSWQSLSVLHCSHSLLAVEDKRQKRKGQYSRHKRPGSRLRFSPKVLYSDITGLNNIPFCVIQNIFCITFRQCVLVGMKTFCQHHLQFWHALRRALFFFNNATISTHQSPHRLPWSAYTSKRIKHLNPSNMIYNLYNYRYEMGCGTSEGDSISYL